MFDGYGYDEPPYKHHVGLLEVAERGLVGVQDSHEGKQHHGDEGSHGQRQRFSDPVAGHQEDDVEAPQGGRVVEDEHRQEDEWVYRDENGPPVDAESMAEQLAVGGYV